MGTARSVARKQTWKNTYSTNKRNPMLIKLPRAKESDVQRAILDWLAYHHVFHYRNNSGGFKDTNQHFYRFGALGSPDIVCVVNGRYVGIEVKASDGRQSDAQKEFQVRLEAAGGLYILAKSIDDIERSLKPLLRKTHHDPSFSDMKIVFKHFPPIGPFEHAA